jgi:hypothetical protein
VGALTQRRRDAEEDAETQNLINRRGAEEHAEGI